MSTKYAQQDESTGWDLHPTPFTNRAIAYLIESFVMGFVGFLLADVILIIVQMVASLDYSFFNGDKPYREAATITLTSILWLWMRVHNEMRGKPTFGKKFMNIKPAYYGNGPTLGRVLTRNIWLVAHLGFMAYVWIAGFAGSWGPLDSASLGAWLLLVAFTCLFDTRNRSFADRWAVVEFVRA